MKPKSKLTLRLAVFVGLPTLVGLMTGEDSMNAKVEKYFGHLNNQYVALWAYSLAVLAAIGLLVLWYICDCKKEKQEGSGKKVLHAVITFGLIYSLVEMTSQTVCAQEIYIVTNQSVTTNMVLVAESVPIPIEQAVINPLLKDAVTEYEQTGNTNIVINKVAYECCWQIIVVVIVIGGVVYVGYKVYKACKNLGENRKKRMDRDDGNDSTSTNHNRSVTARMSLPEGAQMYCASFAIAAGPATPEDNADCGCSPPFSFRYTVSQSGVQMSSYGATDTIDSTTYLADHGLSTNEVVVGESYSYNGQPTNYLPQITFVGGVVSVNLPNHTNIVTHTVQTSSDLVNWTNVVTVSLPIDARTKGSLNPSGIQFLRITK